MANKNVACLELGAGPGKLCIIFMEKLLMVIVLIKSHLYFYI